MTEAHTYDLAAREAIIGFLGVDTSIAKSSRDLVLQPDAVIDDKSLRRLGLPQGPPKAAAATESPSESEVIDTTSQQRRAVKQADVFDFWTPRRIDAPRFCGRTLLDASANPAYTLKLEELRRDREDLMRRFRAIGFRVEPDLFLFDESRIEEEAQTQVVVGTELEHLGLSLTVRQQVHAAFAHATTFGTPEPVMRLVLDDWIRKGGVRALPRDASLHAPFSGHAYLPGFPLVFGREYARVIAADASVIELDSLEIIDQAEALSDRLSTSRHPVRTQIWLIRSTIPP